MLPHRPTTRGAKQRAKQFRQPRGKARLELKRILRRALMKERARGRWDARISIEGRFYGISFSNKSTLLVRGTSRLRPARNAVKARIRWRGRKADPFGFKRLARRQGPRVFFSRRKAQL